MLSMLSLFLGALAAIGCLLMASKYLRRRLYIIPDRFVAALARLRPQSLMGAADLERAPVQIQLAS